MQAIQDVSPDIVEIVTYVNYVGAAGHTLRLNIRHSWNDYAESHYIGDINPNMDLGDLAPNYVGFHRVAYSTVTLKPFHMLTGLYMPSREI